MTFVEKLRHFTIPPTKQDFNYVKKIGIYGGSFNPIHNGHVQTAKFLLKYNIVDEVHFLLNPKSPFKTMDRMPDPFFRASMIEEVVKKINIEYYSKCVKLNTTEMMDNARGEICYTVGTLKKLLYSSIEESGGPKEFVLIIGADVFNSIKNFKDWEWFLETKLIKFIIMPRGGYSVNEELSKEFEELIIDVDFSTFKPIELSSSKIRGDIKNGNLNEVKKHLPTEVYNYIKSKKLYI